MYTYLSTPVENVLYTSPVDYVYSSSSASAFLYNIVNPSYRYYSKELVAVLYRMVYESKVDEVEQGLQSIQLYARCKSSDNVISNYIQQQLTLVRTRSFSDDFSDRFLFDSKWKYNKLNAVDISNNTLTITNTNATTSELVVKSLAKFDGGNNFDVDVMLNNTTGAGGLFFTSYNNSMPQTQFVAFGVFYKNGNTYCGDNSDPVFITVGTAPIYFNIVSSNYTVTFKYKMNVDDAWITVYSGIINVGTELVPVFSHYGASGTLTSFKNYVINTGLYKYY